MKKKKAEPAENEIEALTLQPEKIAVYRKRLSNISWFNRCLNECIARMANAEDECKGRFWEGRFKCQRVSELSGVLTCAAYIDLNPIRAGMAKTLEASDHTSIQDRIHERAKAKPKRCQNWPRVPLLKIEDIMEERLSSDDYLRIVDETGRLMVSGKNRISAEVSPILERLALNATNWVEATQHFKYKFRRMVGPKAWIRQAAHRIGKSWFQGLTAAQELFGRSTTETKQ